MSDTEAPKGKKQQPSLMEIMQSERDRLLKLREEVEGQRAQLDTKLEEIGTDLHRIDLFLNPPAIREPTPAPRKPRAAPTGTRAPRGEHRQRITALLKEHKDGLSGGDLIDKLGARGDKKASQAIANALSNMRKGNELRTQGAGKATRYFAPVDNA